MNTPKCAHCGKELTLNDRYCSQCGTECRTAETDFKPTSNDDEVKRCMAMLNQMEGLDKVKKEIGEIVEFVKMDCVRTQMLGYPSRFPRKYLFVGNPCSGRTTVARILTDILYALGVMPERKMIAVWSKALLGGSIEKCQSKVHNTIESAIGGVLYIDDIHLLHSNKDSLTQATVEALIAHLHKHQDNLLCIVAGTPVEIEDMCKAHPQFRQQFDKELIFER